MQDKTRKSPVNFWYVAAVVLPLIVLANIGYCVYFGSTENYKLDKIADILSNVPSTNSINAKMGYMQDTLVALTPYSGNTGFWWPTPYTDIDAIKQDIQQTITDTAALKNDVNQMAYQQQIANLDSNSSYMNTRIHTTAQAMGLNPLTNPIGYILLIAGALSIPALKLADRISYDQWKKQAKTQSTY